MKEELFIYGTLIEPDIQNKVIGRTIEGSSDILEGYKRTTIRIFDTDYPDIVQEPGRHVSGLVIDVSPEELILIDGYETEWYKRKKVVLKSKKNAWVYQGNKEKYHDQNIGNINPDQTKN